MNENEQNSVSPEDMAAISEAKGVSPDDMAAVFGADSVTLAEAQRIVDEWIRSVGLRYFEPLTNMAILTEETGEVARIMARTYGEQSFKPGEKADLGDELADLLWVTIAIANQTGVDLTEAFRRNLAKKTQRDASRHHNNPKLHDNK